MANLIKKGKEVICVAGNPIQQPRRKSLSRQVMESIEKLILEQDLKPGDVLPTETQISETLQVSKSSVREAVKMLEALGVVEIRRGLCTVISANPEQGYLNVMLSHLYLNSGNEEELQVFRRTVESDAGHRCGDGTGLGGDPGVPGGIPGEDAVRTADGG